MTSKNVKVAIKVRPLINSEEDAQMPQKWIVKNNTITNVTSASEPFILGKYPG
jgi:hypothetical protein